MKIEYIMINHSLQLT